MESFGFPLEAVVVLFVVVAASVWCDLFSHRNSTEIKFKDALGWSIFWVALAIAFYAYLYLRYDAKWADLFLTGYVLEKTLSVDNMMVFIAIFASFGIKGALQHRVLYYGIIGALLFRAIFIAVGTSLFGLSVWVEFIFGLIVAWTAVMMLKGGGDDEETEDYSNHWSVSWTKKLIPVLPRLSGNHFFVKHNEVETLKANDPSLNVVGKAAFYATPLFLCLICIEISDIVFSFDSVPAIIAVTEEPFLIYAAVIFAILGLRNLYFMLAVAAKYLCHLEKAVAFVLFFIAFKLCAQAAEHIWGFSIEISHSLSLFIVLGTIALGVVASIVFPEKEEPNSKESEVV
ncbi:TerC/Alx family metal homeostasis membrane protein [Endozoicomonas sp. SM1973]|uniref:TerC/Alx family metal homeostasis membrane protein n=1 Tax=Spartinivicinus marinus TaxID=2994442 RepID=A0A853I754_9GAMM|nr:TerC/Alx family metal homeostasis membrane protein [Spartinivicinus marinus]MCX4029019.1 TerC/Alx family metal homeostasis membrane protein [Spartinivicinus marinus]NYZ65397.1 TerC/Alx family metal homeostasis membrane protein [Spartinivicinus marinus]